MPKQGTYNYSPATVDSLNAEEASNLKVNDVSRWDCLNASQMQHLVEKYKNNNNWDSTTFCFDCKIELHDIIQFCKLVILC